MASYARPMTMSSPYQTDPYHRGSAWSRSLLPLALITLGVVFLLGNLIPDRARGGLVVLGLGAHLSLQEAQRPQFVQGGGWFFVLLGLGFMLVYVIGARPSAVWPLFPGTILIGLGLLLFGVGSLGALA